MKKLMITGALFLSLAAGTCFAKTADEVAVEKNVEAMRVALLASDTGTLKTLIAPQLSYGHTNGYLENNKAFIDAVETGDAVYKRLEWSEQKTDIDGDVAIVRNRMISSYLNKGKPGEADIGVIQVWKKNKKDGKWRMISRQAHNRLQ